MTFLCFSLRLPWSFGVRKCKLLEIGDWEWGLGTGAWGLRIGIADFGLSGAREVLDVSFVRHEGRGVEGQWVGVGEG